MNLNSVGFDFNCISNGNNNIFEPTSENNNNTTSDLFKVTEGTDNGFNFSQE